MNNPVVLDSCVLASFLLNEDHNHTKADKIITRIFANSAAVTIILPPVVLYETGMVGVRMGENETIIANRLFKLLSYDQVVVIGLSELAIFKHLRRTARSHLRQPQIKSHDMLILNTAIDLGAAIITFDQALRVSCQRLGQLVCATDQELADYLAIPQSAPAGLPVR